MDISPCIIVFFKYCGILTCYIHGYDFILFQLARKKQPRNAICSCTSYLNKYCAPWQEEQEAADASGGTGCPLSRQPHSHDWARVRSSLQSCQLHLWHNYVKVAQKLQVSWRHSGRQSSSCGGIDHAAQAGTQKRSGKAFHVLSDCSCPRLSRGPRRPRESLALKMIVAIPSWHFRSVPVCTLSLSSALLGQHCTQLKTCNSLSGI